MIVHFLYRVEYYWGLHVFMECVHEVSLCFFCTFPLFVNFAPSWYIINDILTLPQKNSNNTGKT